MRVSKLIHLLTDGLEYDHIVYFNGKPLNLNELHQIRDGIGKGIHIVTDDDVDGAYFNQADSTERRLIFAEALNLLEEGSKIRAVKYLREKFDLGLREGIEALNFAVFKWRPELRKLLDGENRLTAM